MRSQPEIVISEATLEGDDYHGQRVQRFVSVESQFVRCDMRSMTIKNMTFGAGAGTSKYVECNFDNSKIDISVVGRARFERCTFRNVIIANLDCPEGEFVDCIFSGKLERAIFYGQVPEYGNEELGRDRNEFLGNDFSETELVDVTFRGGVDLSHQKLPMGPQYVYLENAEEVLRRTRAEIITWRNLSLRRGALDFLSGFEEDVAGGQEQIFWCINDSYRIDSQSAEVLRNVLEKYQREILEQRETRIPRG